MNRLLSTLLLVAALLPFGSFAQTAAPAEKYQAGKHYMVIEVPVRTANPDKIELNEVFWYGCPHCFHFEPVLEPWLKTLPADVDVERTPAMWRPVMDAHSRMYYIAKQLNILDAVHEKLFKALQEEKKPASNENEVAAIFVALGQDEAAVRKAYNSFSVQAQVKQADARVRSYGVEGVPEIIVNGKYRISGNSAGSEQEMLKVAEFLIEKERKAKAGKN